MSERSAFAVLLDVLEESLEGAGEVTRRSPQPTTISQERREAVIDHLRESPEAQVTLFQLALEVKANATESPETLREELQDFAAAVNDQFGVDLLATVAANRDRLNGQLPPGLVVDETVA